jgi:hypothetical protein
MIPALSIRQPWAWLICHAGKNIENRPWRTQFRGRFLRSFYFSFQLFRFQLFP